MTIHQPVLALSLLCLLAPAQAPALELQRNVPADKTDPEVVFAWQNDAVLTQEGIDAAFSKVPESLRPAFIRDGAQVDRLVRNLMKNQVIALDAIRNGLDQDPLVRERLIQAAHKELAQVWVERLKDNAPEADYEAMAHEDYLANPKKYQTGEYLDVTHILIGTENRSEEEAQALARSVRERALEAPESFKELVIEYSDDPAKSSNQGSYLRMGRGQMAKPFEDAAYALEDESAISEPVKTDFGFHIIRLDKRYAPKRKEFEEVRKQTVAEMEQKHRSEYQERYIKGLLAEGIVLPEGSVEIMLKRHFGENLEGAPQY